LSGLQAVDSSVPIEALNSVRRLAAQNRRLRIPAQVVEIGASDVEDDPVVANMSDRVVGDI
jgi:hypothetical protein